MGHLLPRLAPCDTITCNYFQGRWRGWQKPDSQWYRLDNAGILYSAIQREEYSAIYRFSAVMTEPVDPAALQHAIDRVHAPVSRLLPCASAGDCSGTIWSPTPPRAPL